jgi:hypothetical protein
MRRTRLFASGLICASLAGASTDVASRAGEPPAPSVEYVRGSEDFAAVARYLTSRKDVDSVLVVFDAISFDPPAGRNEYQAGHRYKEDLPAWTAALAAASGGPPLFAATTFSARPVRVGAAKWEDQIQSELGRTWWKERKFEGFEPAARGLARLCGEVPGKRRLVALVAGMLTPEQWTSRDASAVDAHWRRALLPVGEYFDEEAVGDALAGKGAVFCVVAPEARFGDFLPVDDVPQAPWATRPSVPWELPVARTTDNSGLSAGEIDELKKKLLAQGIPAPEVERLVKGLRPSSTLDDPSYAETGRFSPELPGWQRPYEYSGLFNTCCPSGYGWWPYARAAAKTAGAYVLYPPPVANWGDPCPRDPSLLDAMAPELVPAAQFVAQRRDDGALAALLAAQRLVFDVTPYSMSGGKKPGSWCGFDAPGRRAKGWRAREIPLDDFVWSDLGVGDKSNEQVLRASKACAAAAARYDEAVAVLDKALADLASGALHGASRRSQANLRLAKFWFEVSAFHLQSLGAAEADVDKARPQGAKLDLGTSRSLAVRLSDCLDAWDGRVVPDEVETRFGSSQFADDPRIGAMFQGNLLRISTGHPFFRAKRSLDRVLANLDPRLAARAKGVVAAAVDVMAHEGRSAWGWTTYYAGLETYRLTATEPAKWKPPPKPAEQGSQPPPPPPESPTTPGSDGGGTTTPK